MKSVSHRGELQSLQIGTTSSGHGMHRRRPRSLPRAVELRLSEGELMRSFAYNALASFIISLARRSCPTSRSRSSIRCALVMVTPSRTLLSISWRLTQSSSVCGTQRIFGPIGSTAAHNESYVPRCSCTRCTASSGSSGQTFSDFFISPSSQG